MTVQPSLFSHFVPKTGETEDGVEDVPGDLKKTLNLRWSVWAKLQKLVGGQTDYVDQWPDGFLD